MLVSGVMDNLNNIFDAVNGQVGEIATEVGTTPQNFSPAIFTMIRNLSENVIMPIAGIILTFIACYELIQLIISYNNLANFETWFIFKWIFKTFVAVELITHTFDFTMAIFEVAQTVVTQAGGIISGSTAVDASTLATMQSTVEAMDIGPLLGKDISIVPIDEKNSYTHVDVAISPQFFAWILSLGDEVKITGPEKIVEEMKEYVQGFLDRYK